MAAPKYVFLNTKTRQFFRSPVEDAVPGFRPLQPYVFACGDVDRQRLETDCSDLRNEGWQEISSPQYINIKLYYMRESGKYYSEGILQISRASTEFDPAKSWYDVFELIKELQKSGNLPGLCKGAKFDVFVTGDEHPVGYPALFKLENL